MIDDGQAVSM